MRCPYCNSADLKVAEGKTSCRTYLREFEPAKAADDSAQADSAAKLDTTPEEAGLCCPKCHSTDYLERLYGRLYCSSCEVLIPCMVRCPMCSQEASSYARNCPACGHPLLAWWDRIKELKTRNLAAIIGLIIAIIWAFFNWPKQ
jgi:hypothetical protein